MFFQIFVFLRFYFCFVRHCWLFPQHSTLDYTHLILLQHFSSSIFSILHGFIFFPFFKYWCSIVFFLGAHLSLLPTLSLRILATFTPPCWWLLNLSLPSGSLSQAFGLNIPHTLTQSDKTEITFPSKPVTFPILPKFLSGRTSIRPKPDFGIILMLPLTPRLLSSTSNQSSSSFNFTT